MKRYSFLDKEDIYSALNKLRNALLAAQNGSDVDEILNGIFTQDEKMKIGRRILIAESLKQDLTMDEICEHLKVGKNTIITVAKNIEAHPLCFTLIDKRAKKVENEYQKNKYKTSGGSKLIFKKKTYSGSKRKDVTR